MSANLLSAEYRQRTLVYLALGGSGARALEPLLHLCALGLGPGQLRVLLVDPDQGNAAITRVGRVLDQYRAARERLADAGGAGGFFRTEVVDALPESRVWSPIADDGYMPDTRFQAGVDRQVMDADAPELGVLFDMLNSRRVREMDLAMGFRGVPSVGTVFMHRLRGEAFFAQLLSQYHAAAGSTVFFAAGSVFGGTGAAALPVVGRALRDGVQQAAGASAIPGAARTRLGAALLLPYFTLPTPGGAPADGGPRPENALFAHNAAGALPSYLDRERDPGYGAYYLVGDSLPREQTRNELGGYAQANAAHYVELFAALAALDFTARGGERDDGLPVYRATGVGSDEPGWGDLPVGRGTRRALKGALVALHTFLTFFRPNGSSPPELAAELHGVTWADLLRLPPATWSDRSDALDAVGLSWMSTWEWLRDLRRSTPALRLAAAADDRPARVPTHALIEGFGRGGARGRRSEDVYSVFRAWNTEAARRRNGGFGAFMEVLRAGSERFSDDRFPEADQPGQEED